MNNKAVFFTTKTPRTEESVLTTEDTEHTE
jgi:hypothetical protein